MLSINTELERCKKKFFCERIQRELNEINESVSRYQYLNGILVLMTKTDNNLDDAIVHAKTIVCKKRWHLIPNYYKKQKVTEYLHEKYGDDVKYKTVEKMLMKKVDDGEINTSKNVTYDIDNEKITKITLSKTEVY